MTLYSYLRDSLRTLISLRSDPRRQKRYPEQSTRQARRKYRTMIINDFPLMQRIQHT